MSSNHKIEDSLREAIISQPDVILDDNDVMQALIAANERAMGGNIVDLRGIAMDRLETRLDRLEDTHRNVQNDNDPAIQRLGDVLNVAEPGFIDSYITGGRGGTVRQVTLRSIQNSPEHIYGGAADWIRSEACLKLNFGAGRLPGLLILGSEDPHMFGAQQGTDLLGFFAGVFERTMRRWLS